MTDAEKPPPKWGILSAGLISSDWCQSLIACKSHIHAVAARDLQRARDFAKKVGATKAHSSYSDLFADPEVDIVYVGTVHTSHFENTKQALLAGKHVLCEKPMGINAAQVKELVQIAKETNRFLLEGMWGRFFPSVRKAREIIDSGSIGSARSVQADFGSVAPKDETHRLWDPSVAGGGILDIGCYVLAAATMVFGPTMPDRVACAGSLSETGVDKEGSISLAWNGQGIAALSYSLCANTPQTCVISCERGRIELHAPGHCPTSMTVRKFEPGRCAGGESETFEFPLPGPIYPLNFPPCLGFLYQVQSVESALRSGKLECPEYPHSESIVLAELMDEYRRQVGVIYPWEK